MEGKKKKERGKEREKSPMFLWTKIGRKENKGRIKRKKKQKRKKR